MKDEKEVNEIEEVKEKNARIAAFFDLDGTLMPLPSLEQRFFRILRYRKEIPLRNYLLWMGEALLVLPRGMSAATHANKMYLHGVQSFGASDVANSSKNLQEARICNESDAENCISSAHAGGHPKKLPSKLGASRGSQAGGQASAAPPKGQRRNPRLPVPLFFEPGVELVAWHATEGHEIVLVSGTLEPLANAAARELEVKLATGGIVAKIRVCATRLEECGGRYTGRIAGEATFGPAKARAMRALAQEIHLDLAHCYAYGDSAIDEPMLACVGNPAAVNPSLKLASIALKRGWDILCWREEKELTERTQSSQRGPRNDSKEKDTLIHKPTLRQAERCT